jgi:hypothetical protein
MVGTIDNAVEKGRKLSGEQAEEKTEQPSEEAEIDEDAREPEPVAAS